jgi:hypothetical protein
MLAKIVGSLSKVAPPERANNNEGGPNNIVGPKANNIEGNPSILKDEVGLRRHQY